MEAEIDADLLIASPCDEGRDRVDVWDEAFHRQPRRHANQFASVMPSMYQRSGISFRISASSPG